METRKQGILRADRAGYFLLYEADFRGCWHYDGPCDQTCAQAGARVQGYAPTNAYGPAEVRAARLGYDILDV